MAREMREKCAWNRHSVLSQQASDRYLHERGKLLCVACFVVEASIRSRENATIRVFCLSGGIWKYQE